VILDHFGPYRKKRDELSADLGYVQNALTNGKNKARAIAEKKIKEIRTSIGIYSS